jgi:NADH-quinone oxidoreductase subunit C
MSAAEMVAALAGHLPEVAIESTDAADHAVTPTIVVPVEHVLAVCGVLRTAPGLEFVAFSDVTAVDFFPHRQPRFDVVYHFVSPHRRARVRMKVRVHGDQSVPSISRIWAGAGWPERELFDLFGIVFDGHDDLRRLMMPEDWEGHPLRKDYPVQLRKDAQTAMPLQVTAEEFRASMERDRYVRTRPASESGGGQATD